MGFCIDHITNRVNYLKKKPEREESKLFVDNKHLEPEAKHLVVTDRVARLAPLSATPNNKDQTKAFFLLFQQHQPHHHTQHRRQTENFQKKPKKTHKKCNTQTNPPRPHADLKRQTQN